jgi:hypothetical protein
VTSGSAARHVSLLQPQNLVGSTTTSSFTSVSYPLLHACGGEFFYVSSANHASRRCCLPSCLPPPPRRSMSSHSKPRTSAHHTHLLPLPSHARTARTPLPRAPTPSLRQPSASPQGMKLATRRRFSDSFAPTLTASRRWRLDGCCTPPRTGRGPHGKLAEASTPHRRRTWRWSLAPLAPTITGDGGRDGARSPCPPSTHRR